jgi:hypothetical protein
MGYLSSINRIMSKSPLDYLVEDDLVRNADLIRNSGLFDENWYLSQYPAVTCDPVLDYLKDGYLKNRNPSPGFDTAFYLETYQDVASAGKNPLLHYLLYGNDEGRLPKAGRALNLERKLWRGFSSYALEELESLKYNPRTEEPEKVSAAWSLMVWHCTQQDYATAFENYTFACLVRDKLTTSKKWAIPVAWCKVKLGQQNSARDLLDGTLKKGGFNPDICLGMSNTAHSDTSSTCFFGSDSFRLHWINRVFENQGFAHIKKRCHEYDLALDNLTSPVQSRSTGRGQGKISVIMPAYNASSTLALAIESILCQTWNDIEIIVVDDCSTDDTFKISRRFAAQDSRVTAVRQQRNMGAYAARNAGVRLCTGDFITVHDSDDWSHPQKIEAQMIPLLNDSRLLGSFSFWVKVDWSMNIVGGWKPWGNLIEFNHSSFLFRRSLLDSIGEWDNVQVTGDTEFIWRAEAKYGKDAFIQVYEDVPLSFSLASQTSLTQAKNKHVKTVLFGLRRVYREAARWWHGKAGECLYLNNDEKESLRPFPAPEAILVESSSKPISLMLVSDFSRQALKDDSGPVEVLEAFSRTGQTALFHWPSYFLDGDDTLDDSVFYAAYKNDIRLLVSGETIYSENVVILKTKPLGWLPDSFPTVRCRSVFILDDGDDKKDQDVSMTKEIRTNIESVFGHPPVNVSFATLQDITRIKDRDLTLRGVNR